MARKVRETSAVKWWSGFCRRHHLNAETTDEAWDELVEYFNPETVRESAASISELLGKLAAAFGAMKEGTDLEDVVSLITRHGDGMDPHNRSTQAAVRKLIKASDLLEHVPAQGERYVRRIGHSRGNGGSQAEADVAGK